MEPCPKQCTVWPNVAKCKFDILLRCFEILLGRYPIEKARPVERKQLCRAP